MPNEIRTTSDERQNTYAVILVGGKGKRLRPFSNDLRPKAFLSVTRDRKTMFRRTIERVADMVRPEHILVVANKAHAALVRRDLPRIADRNLILETVSRNTAPAIALAAYRLQGRGLNPVMVVLPTDQYILDPKEYLTMVRRGIEFIRKRDSAVVVLGAEPDRPATGYGYINVRRQKGQTAKQVRRVEKFVEKPGIAKARECIRKGYLWNTGLFIFRARTILELIKKFEPRIYDCLKNIKRYKSMPDISIDYAVMERADNIYCVSGRYRWQDMGEFENIAEILKREGRPFVMKNGKIVKVI